MSRLLSDQDRRRHADDEPGGRSDDADHEPLRKEHAANRRAGMPIARRIPISRVLSVTTIVSVLTMLNAATTR